MKEGIEKKLGVYLDISPELMELLEKDLLEAMWLFNVNTGKLEWINQSFLESIECPTQESKYHEAWTKSAKTGEYESFKQRVQEYLKGERESSFQTIMYHRNLRGKTLAYLYQANLYQTKNGKQKHLIGVCSDLYGTGNILEDFMDRMKIQEFLFDNSKDAFYAFDESGIFLDIPGRKDHNYDLLPYGEVIGKKVSDIFPAEISAKVDQALNHLKSSNNNSVTISYVIDNELLVGGGARFFDAVIHRLPKNRYLVISRDRTEDIQTQNILEKRAELQALILEISAEFINDLKTFGNHINDTMARLGRAVECDRVYIFKYDFENELTHNTYEWCAEGISPEIENLQNVPLDQVDESWMSAHKKGQVHEILNVGALPEESDLKPILEAQGIKSLVTVPLGRGNSLSGFVGFDWVEHHFKPFEEQVNLLKMFADLFHSAMIQQDFIEQIELQNKFSSELIEKIDTPLIVIGREGQVRDINSAFSKLMVVDRDDIIGINPPYPWWPEDQVSQLMGETKNFIESDTWKKEHVFKNGNGTYFSALVSGRRLKSKEGYVHYATVEDLTEREKVIKSLKETENWLTLSQRSAKVAHFGFDLISNKFESSREFYKILGIEESKEFNESKWWKLIPTLLRKEYNKKLKEAIEDRKPLSLVIEVVRPADSKKVWLHVDGVINYTRSGEAVDLQGTIRDVTKEQGYIRKIEKQNQRLKEIAWLQSHELRAPLVRIMSIAKALNPLALDLESQELIDLMGAASKDMDAIIGKLVRKAESFGLGEESIFTRSSEAEWKIAVVDDDPIINRLAAHQLKALNLEAEVLTFNGGHDFKEFLEEFINQSKDQNLLILLDINMPHFNGWDVLSFISKESLDSKVQVAMFSSSISASDKKKAMAYPFVRDFLEKPLEKGALEDLLSNLNLLD